VMVDPSWNFTPLRSLNSQVVSLSAFHDSASDGSNSSFALRCRSESNMLMLTRIPTRSKCMCGSRVGAWDGSATVIVSLPCEAAGRGRARSAARARTSRPGSQRFMESPPCSRDDGDDDGPGESWWPTIYHVGGDAHNCRP